MPDKRDLTNEAAALGDAKKALDQAHSDLLVGIQTTNSVTRVAVAKVKDALSDYQSAVPRYQKPQKQATVHIENMHVHDGSKTQGGK